MLKKIFSAVLGMAHVFSAAGCSQTSRTSSKGLKVVCATAPLYDWTKNITEGTDSTDLSRIIGNGTDLHSFQPSAADIISIKSADVLVYVGGALTRLGQVEYNPSWHAIDYIAAAGINTISGTWSQVKVWRGKNPDALSVSVTEDQILPGDYIEVPKSHYESFKDFTLFLASLLSVVSAAFIIYATYND